MIQSVFADPGVVSLIPARPHTLVEIDHEIFSTVILLLTLILEVLLSYMCYKRKYVLACPGKMFGEVN